MTTEKDRHRWRFLVKLVIVTLVTLIVTAFVIEGGIRLFDPYGVSHFSDMPRYFSELCQLVGPPLIIRHKPNAVLELRHFSMRTNALGFRDRELAAEKPEGELRILFLGDSVLMGWGVNRGDHFLTLTEAELNDHASKGRSFRLVNSGHNQFDTFQEHALLLEKGDLVNPDMVMLVFINNDVIPTIRTYEKLVAQSLEARNAKKTRWTTVSGSVKGFLRKVFRGINDLTAYYETKSDLEVSFHDLKARDLYYDEEGWSRAKHALIGIKSWCDQREIPFIVLNHTLPDTGEGEPEVPSLVPLLEEQHIPWFPFHFTKAEYARPIRNSSSDAHANELGHELLRDKLWRIFQRVFESELGG